MIIAIIILFICVLVLYAKIAGLESALQIHIDESSDEAHPKPEKDYFDGSTD